MDQGFATCVIAQKFEVPGLISFTYVDNRKRLESRSFPCNGRTIMEHREIIKRLAGNEALIQGLVSGLDETQSRWRPEPGKWSVLEVINHLYDEEREDFRHRLDLTLHTSDAAWTPNDPERWVSERKYNERDLKNSLENLISERRKSIAWLNALESPEWNSAYEHPVFGSIAAGDILCAWLAHAYFHARQISNLFIEYTRVLSNHFSTGYAFG